MEADHFRNLQQLQAGVLQQKLGLFNPHADNVVGEINAVFLLELAGDILTADKEFAGNLLQREVGLVVLVDIFNDLCQRIALLDLSGRQHPGQALHQGIGPVPPGEQ
ncbi:hypothetical protein D3C76_1601900 [compost metagenome]